MPQGHSWSNVEVALLVHYWNNTNKSATAIGKLVGRTRNAVIGKVHRLPNMASRSKGRKRI